VVSTVLCTDSFLQISWSLQRSYLPTQPFLGPRVIWYVSKQPLNRSLHTDVDYSLHRLSNLKIGLTAGVTGQQGMLTPPYLIPPLAFPGVRVNLPFTVDYSIIWTGHWFWLQIFPFTWPWVTKFLLKIVLFTWFRHSDFHYWFLRLIWGARRTRPVRRRYLLLHGTWSHLWSIQWPMYAHSLICISYRTNEIDYCSETRVSGYTTGSIKCKGGVCIPCWPVTPVITHISRSG
jgi:hypothetical protein